MNESPSRMKRFSQCRWKHCSTRPNSPNFTDGAPGARSLITIPREFRMTTRKDLHSPSMYGFNQNLTFRSAGKIQQYGRPAPQYSSGTIRTAASGIHFTQHVRYSDNTGELCPPEFEVWNDWGCVIIDEDPTGEFYPGQPVCPGKVLPKDDCEGKNELICLIERFWELHWDFCMTSLVRHIKFINLNWRKESPASSLVVQTQIGVKVR